MTVERVDKQKNVEWYKPVYICAFAGYAKITSSAQKVYTDMLFLALKYRVKYTESKSDIKNYNFFYKNTKNAKLLSNFWKILENRKIQFVILYYI